MLVPPVLTEDAKFKVSVDTYRGSIHVNNPMLASFFKRCVDAVVLFDKVKQAKGKDLVAKYRDNGRWNRTEFMTAVSCMQTIAPSMIPTTKFPTIGYPEKLQLTFPSKTYVHVETEFMEMAQETWQLIAIIEQSWRSWNEKKAQGNVKFVDEIGKTDVPK